MIAADCIFLLKDQARGKQEVTVLPENEQKADREKAGKMRNKKIALPFPGEPCWERVLGFTSLDKKERGWRVRGKQFSSLEEGRNKVL